MKILMVSSLYPPFVIGGAEISTYKLTNELVRTGTEVVVLTTGETDSEEIRDGVKILFRRMKNITSFWKFKHDKAYRRVLYKLLDYYNRSNAKIISEILRTEKPDLIHINNLYGFSPVIWDCADKAGVPIVQTLRDYYLMCPKANLMKKELECSSPNPVCKMFRSLYRKKSRLVQAVTAPSAYTLNRFLEDSYFPGSESQVIYNAIDFSAERFEKIAGKRSGGSSDEKHIVFVGSLIATKGIRYLLEAVEKCPSNFYFHFAGKGKLQTEIEECAKKHPNIILEGFLTEDKLNSLLEKMDMLICPSIWAEPFGRVIIDGYRSCLPVIVTNCGGMPELVDDGKTGRIIEAKSADAIAGAVMDVASWEMDSERIGQIREKLNEFSIEKQGELFTKLYGSLIE